MFNGIRIVELGQYVMVPAASHIFADFGAEVIKVETPGAGDPYRSLVLDKSGHVGANFSLEQNNRGKKSICIDLKSDEGRMVFCDLIKTADVFMTSVRPSALERLQITADELRVHNPRLIYARANGLGFAGPEADKAGFDATAFWSRGGFGDLLSQGRQYVRQPRAVGDHATSVALAFGIAGALFKRATTGEPSIIETSLLSMATWILSNDLVAAQDRDRPASSSDNMFEHNPLAGVYQTRDGRYMQLVFLDSQRFWPGLCAALDRPELARDPRFGDAAARSANGRTLIDLLTDIFASRDWAQWRSNFEPFDAPWEMAQSLQDLYADQQVAANGMLFDITTLDGFPVKLVAPPLTVDGQPAHATLPAPACGQHSDELLAELGIDDARIAQYRTAGVIG